MASERSQAPGTPPGSHPAAPLHRPWRSAGRPRGGGRETLPHLDLWSASHSCDNAFFLLSTPCFLPSAEKGWGRYEVTVQNENRLATSYWVLGEMSDANVICISLYNKGCLIYGPLLSISSDRKSDIEFHSIQCNRNSAQLPHSHQAF